MTFDKKPKWPRRFPWSAVGYLMLACVLTVFAIWARAKIAGPVQTFYLPRYIVGTVGANWHLPNPKRTTVTPNYRDVKVAYCGDFAALPTVCNGPHSVQILRKDPVKFDKWLTEYVYDGQPLVQWIRVPLWFGAIIAFPFLLFGFREDRRHNREARQGVHLRGPRIATPRQFNKEIKGDGFKVWLEGNKYTDWLRREKDKHVQIEKIMENSHLAATADPGGGKSLIAKQLLSQVLDRGEVAIVYDPHLEFTQAFFDPSKGHQIMNPLDRRCPSWSPSDEIDRSDRSKAQANALAQAKCLYPGKPGDRDYFFAYCCQQIWAYLIVEYGPDARQMSDLLRHAEPLIDMMVEGTELEAMMAHNAANQRAGVIAQLTQICYALDQIPSREEGRPHIVLRDWAKTRPGWLFFTNTQETRDALRPIQSLWLDWLIMCILSEGERSDLPNTFILFDELHTLQKLNQFVSMLTEGRKTLRGMYCIQGRAQIKELYGDLAETLLSAPYTKFFMRTTEPEASKWMSETVGDIEISRVTQSRPVGTVLSQNGRAAGNYTEGKVIEKLLLASQFSGLRSRHGFIKYGELVVRCVIPFKKYERIAEGYEPRTGNPVEPRTIPTIEEARAEMVRRSIEQQRDSRRMMQVMRAAEMEDEQQREQSDLAEALSVSVQAAPPRRRGRPPGRRNNRPAETPILDSIINGGDGE